jgi:hydrogenase maturation protease
MAKRTLVLGMGNPILADDGAGLCVARLVREKSGSDNVDVEEASVYGLALLDTMRGYDKVIIVDVIQTEGGQPGSIYRIDPTRLGQADSRPTAHSVNLETAVALGRRIGLPLPSEIVIFAIEGRDVSTFAERCTPEVERAIPAAAKAVIDELDRASLQPNMRKCRQGEEVIRINAY